MKHPQTIPLPRHKGCSNCGAPRTVLNNVSSQLHVPGCGPDAKWEARIRIGRGWGPWGPIEARDAWVMATQRADVQVRRVPTPWTVQLSKADTVPLGVQ